MSRDKQNFVSSNKLAEHLQTAQAALAGLEAFLAALNDEYLDYEAWSVFHVWLDGRPRKEAPYFSAFRSWQLFHWQPAPGTVPLPISSECKTIAETYLNSEGLAISDDQRKILLLGVKHSPDIFEITSFEDDIVHAIGCVSRKKIQIVHPGLSTRARLGDFLMGHAVPVENGAHILLGASQTISRKGKPVVEEFIRLIERLDDASGSFEMLQTDFLNLFYDLTKYSSDK